MPAILPVIGQSPLSVVRHAPLLLFLAGLPFFLIALADPFTSLTQQEVTFPGRRIGLLIDASSSMMEPFKAQKLGEKAPSDAVLHGGRGGGNLRQDADEEQSRSLSLIEFGDEYA
jgi:hypothetical protein